MAKNSKSSKSVKSVAASELTQRPGRFMDIKIAEPAVRPKKEVVGAIRKAAKHLAERRGK